MPDETTRFQTAGPSWSERASLGQLQAVLSPTGTPRENQFLHGVNSYGASQARRYFRRGGQMIDFGCGTGRFTQFFASQGARVLATEITPEMLAEAKRICTSPLCSFVLTDGLSIPKANSTVDCVWCCGVLRYSLFVPNPAYAEIASEMFRALRPGGYVVNLEMYVDVAPKIFTADFERVGFRTRRVSVLQRYGGRPESWLSHRFIPERWLGASAGICAFLRSALDRPDRAVPGLRDYLFVWQKPEA